MADLNSGVNLVLKESNSLVLQKILNWRYLDQDNHQQYQEQDTGYYPKNCFKGYASESFQGYKFFKRDRYFNNINKKPL